MVHRTRADFVGLASFAAVFLACAVVGWRSYPYWATGVYQVGIGAFPPMDQDPKRMIPMLWIGDLWRLPVLLLYWLCYVAIRSAGCCHRCVLATMVRLWYCHGALHRHCLGFHAGLFTGLRHMVDGLTTWSKALSEPALCVSVL